MTRIAFVLCAALALGANVVAAQAAQAAGTDTSGVVGTAPAVDETTLAIGDGTATVPAGQQPAGPSTLEYFLRMLLVLALVLGAIYGIYRLMRRLARPRPAGDSPIRLLGSTSLSPGRGVHVVSLGSKAWLVGSAEGSVSLIAELQDRELIEALELKAATAPVPGEGKADFASMLGGLLGKAIKPKRGSAESDGDFLAKQRERLRKF